jgi:peptidoglycan/LPS O-acetylase OafA/YrhL
MTLLIYSLTDRAGLLSRLLSVRVLEAVGLASYATYMVHFFVRDWIKFLFERDGIPPVAPACLYIAVVAGASALLYNYVEKPGRRWFRALALRETTSPVRTPAAQG